MPRYNVEVLRVIEVEVEATDELQAEREALAKIVAEGNEIALLVQDADECDGGALASEDNCENWAYAKKHFYTLDFEWINQ